MTRRKKLTFILPFRQSEAKIYILIHLHLETKTSCSKWIYIYSKIIIISFFTHRNPILEVIATNICRPYCFFFLVYFKTLFLKNHNDCTHWCYLSFKLKPLTFSLKWNLVFWFWTKTFLEIFFQLITKNKE